VRGPDSLPNGNSALPKLVLLGLFQRLKLCFKWSFPSRCNPDEFALASLTPLVKPLSSHVEDDVFYRGEPPESMGVTRLTNINSSVQSYDKYVGKRRPIGPGSELRVPI